MCVQHRLERFTIYLDMFNQTRHQGIGVILPFVPGPRAILNHQFILDALEFIQQALMCQPVLGEIEADCLCNIFLGYETIMQVIFQQLEYPRQSSNLTCLNRSGCIIDYIVQSLMLGIDDSISNA